MKTIKFMLDYGCFPLWDADDVGEIDPNDLPISEDLCVLISDLATEYDQTLDVDTGHSLISEDENAKQEIVKSATVVCERLRAELGAEYEVHFVSPFMRP